MKVKELGKTLIMVGEEIVNDKFLLPTINDVEFTKTGLKKFLETTGVRLQIMLDDSNKTQIFDAEGTFPTSKYYKEIGYEGTGIYYPDKFVEYDNVVLITPFNFVDNVFDCINYFEAGKDLAELMTE